MEFSLRIHVDDKNNVHYFCKQSDSFSFVLGEDILPFIYRDVEKDFRYLKEEIALAKDIEQVLMAFSDSHSVLNGELGSPLYLLLYRDVIDAPDVPISELIEKKETEYIEAKRRIRFLAESLYEWQETLGESEPDFGDFNYGKLVTSTKKLAKGVSTEDSLYPTTVLDVVNYVFLKMLKHNVRLIRCKNCHRLFPEYSKRHIEYCDYYSAPNNDSTCRMGAVVHLSDSEYSYNEIMALFNKHYKTPHARMRAKNVRITKQELDEWTKRARKARELTADGRYSLEEFEKFLKGEESEIKIP
jgi:hypothetical protein